MALYPTANLPFLALPETVFFPHTFVDLELGLPHHQELFSSAQSQGLPVGVFLAKRYVSEAEPEPYARLGSFGRIVDITTSESGTSSVTLHGLFRARIKRVVRLRPHPIADITVLTDHLHVTSTQQFRRTLADLVELVQRFKLTEERPVVTLPKPERWREFFGTLVNAVATFLPAEAHRKQEWLKKDDLIERYELMRQEMVKLWKLNQVLSQVPPADNPHLN
ncbi:MAG: hypothetical protein DRI48_10960 [Chloroflexi bacterium]|nr:MAG: hypothetical protein DRI48_10960 [Chloroflexota bacterium]